MMDDTELISKDRGWFHTIDIAELVCAIVVSVIWGGLSFIRPNDLAIPDGDSQSSYPYIEGEVFPTLWMALTVFGVAWITIWGFYFLKKKFPRYFRKFNPFSAMWIHITCISLTNIVTSMLSIYVGRVRPDFYKRCGKTATVETCSVLTESEIAEELRSFPSSHAATSLAGFLFLTLLIQKATLVRPSYVSCLYMIGTILAFWIGATRIRSYKSHIDDVVGGFVVAAVCTGVIWNGSFKRIFRHLKEEHSDVA